MSQKLRNFCFTINNWKEEDITLAKQIDYKYIIIGKEVGEKGTPHLQGYVELSKQMRLNAVKKFFPRAHIEERKGTAQQASIYCKKDNNYEELGTISKQGQRNDISSTYEMARNGLSFEKFLDTNPNFQNIRIFEIAKSVYQQKRHFKPYVEWIYGPTGTGKTRYVVEHEKDLWISGRNLKWWQGYDNQEATLFDDFRKDFCTFHELLRILDRYPYTVEVKGGHKELNSKRMYISSCFHPKDIYDTREDVNQLLRRIDKVTAITNDNYTTVVTQKSGGNTIPPTSKDPICLI